MSQVRQRAVSDHVPSRVNQGLVVLVLHDEFHHTCPCLLCQSFDQVHIVLGQLLGAVDDTGGQVGQEC